MKAIHWENDTAIESDTFIPSMYDYTKPLDGSENTESRWANAVTEDGSYWVWIPRYAYKVTYYTDSTKTTVSETETAYRDFDVIFLNARTNECMNQYGELEAFKFSEQ